MNLKSDLFDFLKAQGLMPEDRDYGIFFRYQMLNFLVIIDEDDDQFLRLALPGIFDVDENNRADVLEACNRTCHRMKVSKCYVPQDDVWVAAEQLLDSDPNYEDIVPRLLNILMQSRDAFYEEIRQ